MKINRYVASEVREALRRVREELGPDAVILSNRNVPDGVELVAAIDYAEDLGANHRSPTNFDDMVSAAREAEDTAIGPDALEEPAGSGPRALSGSLERELSSLRGLLEQQLSGLAWGELGRRHPVRASLIRRLLQLGLANGVADQIAGANRRRDLARAWREALGRLAAGIPTPASDPVQAGGVVALVGPTGVGKTTTVAKLAANYRMKNGADSVALLTTDNFRVGAQEQLRTYGRLMGIPVAVCTHPDELTDALERYRRRPLILIDTAGMSHRDTRLTEQSQLLEGGASIDRRALRRYLVLSATTAPRGLEEIARAYREVELEGAVITKIDEATSLGGVLSVLYSHELGAVYTCDGQRVPEDLAPADVRSLVKCAVKLARENRRPAEESLELAYGGLLANA